MKYGARTRRQRWLRDGPILALAGCALFAGVRWLIEYTALPSTNSAVYVEVNDWEKYATAGHRIGPSQATVTMVEFIDYACQACKDAEADLELLRDRYSADLLMVYRYLPTTSAESLEAFRFVECAARIGRFSEVHKAVLAHVDSLSTWNWADWLSGTSDESVRAAYMECVETDIAPHIAAIHRDTIAANELGLRGTPSFLINNMLVEGHPGLATLDEVIRIALHR